MNHQAPRPWRHEREVQRKYDSNTGEPTTWSYDWIYDADGKRVANSLDVGIYNATTKSAVAPYIVKCVNMHDELVELLKQAWACIEHNKERVPAIEKEDVLATLREIQQGIAKAEQQ